MPTTTNGNEVQRDETIGSMVVPERVRELLEEFSQVQAEPITDPALIERMRTDATT